MSPAGLPEFHNRTLICSVLFIDIVEYSRKSVVDQGRLKDRFNALLSEALRGVALNDRIILDTGDGAAISFIGDPEDALFVATSLRDVIENDPQSPDVRLSTRIGINLGPVRLVKDINGQPNIIGDGINVAQRVMTFAKPGQVLVSRSYYEVVSRLSEESSKLFSYEGARTDKHVREHEVYAVGSTPTARRRTDVAAEAEAKNSFPGARRAGAIAAITRVFGRPAVASLLAIVAIVGMALLARGYRETHEPVRTVTAEPAVKPPPSPPVGASAPLPRIRGLPPEREPPAQAPSQASESHALPPTVPAKEKTRSREKAAATEAAATREGASAAPAGESAAIGTPALVSFAVSPWGEVHVDGRMQGVSPPLQDLELTPGRHRIEIRNSAAQPHVVTLNAKAGERIRIKHKFD